MSLFLETVVLEAISNQIQIYWLGIYLAFVLLMVSIICKLIRIKQSSTESCRLIVSTQKKFIIPYIFSLLAQYFTIRSQKGFAADAMEIIGDVNLFVICFAISLVSIP